MEASHSTLNLLRKINLFFQLILLTVLSQIVIRVSELIHLNLNFEITTSNFLEYSINFDTLTIAIISLFFLPVYLLLSYISNSTSKISLLIFFSFLVFVNSILSTYYIITLDVLSNTFQDFSLIEIGHIVLSEIQSRFSLLVTLVLINGLAFFILKKRIYSPVNKLNILNSVLFALIAVIAIGNSSHTTKQIHHFDSKTEYQYYNSKLAFFIKSFNAFNSKSEYSQIEQTEFITSYQQGNNQKEFISQSHPLLNKHEYKNVLGPFFKKSKTNPNVVIIISESLSRSFMGSNSTYNLATFSDSLAKHGLMWNNFFSNAEKSYGVLPSLLASLPNGINGRGFTNQLNDDNQDYPNHSSIFKIAKNNGYETSFYYGGWGEFDHVNSWIKNAGVDKFVDESQFAEKYQRFLKSKTENMVWGFNDSILFDQAYSKISNTNSPFLSVIQTISLHSPYNLAPKRYFDRGFQENKISKLDLNIDSIKGVTTNEMACILFSDDALKGFFNKMRESPYYDNTIFIITGDHALGGGLVTNNLKSYHVPLIIYSPLITSTQVFNGVSSHVDFVPSILSLLNGNFQFNINQMNSWVGNDLDTSTIFQIKHPVFFNLGRTDLPLALFKTGLFFDNSLYPVDSSLNISRTPNQQDLKAAQKQLETMTFINGYIMNNNKIWSPNN